jgi:predicted phage terminase large subunit-like protein
MYRQKVEYPQAKRDFIARTDNFNPSCIYVEDASNGTPLCDELKTNIKYLNRLKPIGTKGKDLATRVIPITPIVEAHNVLLPDWEPWTDIFIEECSNFTGNPSDHDDIVAALVVILENERQNINPMLSFVRV